MSELEETCNDIAASVLILANTPLYIVKSLRARSEVAQFAALVDSDYLVSKFVKALKAPRKTLRTQSRPYLYAVVLGMKGDTRALNMIRGMTSQQENWLCTILDFISKTVQKTSIKTVDASSQGIGVRNSGINKSSLKSTVSAVDLGGTL